MAKRQKEKKPRSENNTRERGDHRLSQRRSSSIHSRATGDGHGREQRREGGKQKRKQSTSTGRWGAEREPGNRGGAQEGETQRVRQKMGAQELRVSRPCTERAVLLS